MLCTYAHMHICTCAHVHMCTCAHMHMEGSSTRSTSLPRTSPSSSSSPSLPHPHPLSLIYIPHPHPRPLLPTLTLTHTYTLALTLRSSWGRSSYRWPSPSVCSLVSTPGPLLCGLLSLTCRIALLTQKSWGSRPATPDNSFLVPIVGLMWAADGSMREVGCQMLTTCILLPYEIASSFFGMGSGGSGAASILGDLEGTLVEVTGASSNAAQTFDEDGSGKIDREEFKAAVECVGLNLPSEELDSLFDEVDSDASGAVSTMELHRVLKEGKQLRDADALESQFEAEHAQLVEAKALLKRHLLAQTAEMARLFKQWDTNDNGLIDINEFVKAVLMCGVPVARETCDATFNEFDSDGSGQLQYAEFLRSMLRDALAEAADSVIEVIEAKRQEADVAPTPAAEEIEEQAAAPEGLKTQSAAPSKGKIKRLKREVYLERVRTRRDMKEIGMLNNGASTAEKDGAAATEQEDN